MARSKERAKFGYLNYADIQTKITDGLLDQYDVVYCKDRHTQYLIDADLKLVEIRSRVYVYETEYDAVSELNKSSDTYIGQIVSVRNGNTYQGYIVNKDSSLNKYYVTPLYMSPEGIDYDDLNNRPIINLSGTSEQPISIKDLDDGTYQIKGVYTAPDDSRATTLLGHLVTIETSEDAKNVTIITSSNILLYTISDEDVEVDNYITKSYLASKGYVAIDDLDAEVSALGYLKQDQSEEYIKSLAQEVAEQVVEQALEDNLIKITDGEINTLFDN